MLLKFFFAVSVFLLSSIAVAMPVVVIDPGHEPNHPGALGTCGKKEVDYNDELAQQIVKTLEKSYQVILTRQPGLPVAIDDPNLQNNLPEREKNLWKKNQSLLARAAIANLNQAQVFISIHHDSTSAEQQIDDPSLCNNHGGKKLKDSFKEKYSIGYNVFLDNADTTPRKEESLSLATAIGKQLRNMGRIPSNYHVYPADPCESCYPVNASLGVWNENLAVLRNTKMPAVLIEVGNIVDPQDEAIINTDAFRAQFSLALKNALDEYFFTPQI